MTRRHLAVALVALVPLLAAADAWRSTTAGAEYFAAAVVRDGGGATRGTMSPADEPQPMAGDCSVVEAAFDEVAPAMKATGLRLARRESNCCPAVRGGDVVDESCNVLYVSTYSHRSDAGLFQLNGVWHGADGVLCIERGLCGPASITSLPIIDQVRLFVAIADRFGLCHWSPPRYCA